MRVIDGSLLKRLALWTALGLAACGGTPEVVGAGGSGNGGNGGGAGLDSGAGGGSLFNSGDGGSGNGGTLGAGGGCTADACAPTSVCGDKKISGAETCDDGNSIPGDGCSGVCLVEAGYRCPTVGQPCESAVTTVCGNGKVEGNEVCDDGNAQSGDGCSSDCQAVEPGYACSTPGQACTVIPGGGYCGDGIVNAGEQCDDGDKPDAGSANGDGCSAKCQLEPGFTCPLPGRPCVPVEYCGDGVVQASLGEACDDGNGIPGDGCSGICTIEPGYSCPTAGVKCVNIWVCGNGKVDPGETCDDGNTTDSPTDGCTANCTVDPGWSCPKAADGTGGACKQAINICGDAVIAGGEECDDGGAVAGDGCSDTCQVESGWTCPAAGAPCVKSAYCGNAVVDLSIGELCDDGGTTGGDGCSPLCQIEVGYACPTPGQPCVSTVKCGDGKIGGTEKCDDGNLIDKDGCSACQVDAGWACLVAGARCVAKQCGDGIVAGAEQCDDGGSASGDGCSATCKLEVGYACTTVAGSPTACHKTTCGDGNREGFEQCDDGNKIPYDGCSPSCTIEPKCAGGQCTAVCGDGFKFPQEACDDGNTIGNDGCSATCTLEPGYACQVVTLAPPAQLVIPILYRDFRYYNTTNGHPDFNRYNGAATGIAQSNLDSAGKPVLAATQGVVTDANSFYTWYHDTQTDGTANPWEKLVYLTTGGAPTTLTLASIGGGAYQFSSTSFFPVDGLGWNASGTAQVDNACNTSTPHNFSFTSELRYQFTYQGGEKLDFTGDDDVFVFVNGQLAVDLGGVHGATNGSTTLPGTVTGLVKGNMYEIALFQAERHTCASNYKLTLTGFVHAVTQCQPICGDGVVTLNEVCDDGVNNGSYGGCMPGCQARGPFCGDAKTQNPPEACDDGVNLGSYGSVKVCAPGCQLAPYCGDAVVSNGESCDEGATNGAGYGHCTASCTLGQRCGDGIVNGPEACDTGINNGSSGSKCAADCTLKCGNGVVDVGEACDDGTAANVGGYGKCNPDCSFGPRCGDGIKNGTETCDDGKNDGTYGTCKSNCTFAGYCGDNLLQTPPEMCDNGPQNSASVYGVDQCTNRCTPAPYCGDRAVDGSHGEVCDDGVNSGKAGSCKPDCSAYVPLNTCGDGKIQAPEQCDTGTSNGTLGSNCDTHCRLKCGNGVKDTGEQCDNGVNDGSYGTCTSTCTLAGYCGDGTVNGPETCDNGSRNVALATAYGLGLCTTACSAAPFCGDGRVQSAFGEECDGGVSCTAACKKILFQ